MFFNYDCETVLLSSLAQNSRVRQGANRVSQRLPNVRLGAIRAAQFQYVTVCQDPVTAGAYGIDRNSEREVYANNLGGRYLGWPQNGHRKSNQPSITFVALGGLQNERFLDPQRSNVGLRPTLWLGPSGLGNVDSRIPRFFKGMPRPPDVVTSLLFER